MLAKLHRKTIKILCSYILSKCLFFLAHKKDEVLENLMKRWLVSILNFFALQKVFFCLLAFCFHLIKRYIQLILGLLAPNTDLIFAHAIFLFHSLSVNLLILEALIECNICKNFFILISNSHMATVCNLFLISNVDHHDRGWLFQQTLYFHGERSYFKRLDIQILQIEI